MNFSSRQLIAGAAAFGGTRIFRVAAGTGALGTPKLKLGIVSDISFITAERWDVIDLKDFRKALPVSAKPGWTPSRFREDGWTNPQDVLRDGRNEIGI